PNYVWDYLKKEKTIGRFGWKANQPNLKQQVAGAFNGDIGLTTSIFLTDHCTDNQQDCKKSINGGNPEISDEILTFTTAYSSSLAVPMRRNVKDVEVLRGKKLFVEAQCATCHTPKFTTQATKEYPEYKGILIRPYTDLLVHDMGEGLADNREDFEANGREWRTPPLWGIGLIPKINEHSNFLHDGRARNLHEAILWHGGEGEAAKDAFLKMSRKDRIALIKFLESL
nr:c-type cytochrome [Thermoflexibacter sp.]